MNTNNVMNKYFCTGLACFTNNLQENTYTAEVFNIFLFPRTLAYQNLHFTCQASALEFLCRNKFDFNKVWSRNFLKIFIMIVIEQKNGYGKGRVG